MTRKKKLFILENGFFLEAKSTRQLKKLVGDEYMFFLCEKEVKPATFLDKITDIFAEKRLKKRC